MNQGITDADLQLLLQQNPLAAEQLRRIMAERQRDELKAQLEKSNNGAVDNEILTTRLEETEVFEIG